MPRSAIPVTVLDRVGQAPPAQTNADATNKHYIASNDGSILVEIVSSDAGSQTVGFQVNVGTVDGITVPDKVVTVPAGATRLVGGFPKGTYNQSDGSVYVNPSVSTTLKFRAYQIPAS